MKRNFLAVVFCFLLFSCQAKHTEVYFSPSLDCETQVINLIDNAQKTVDVAIYSFNNENIANALYRAYRKGIRIRILADKSQAAQKKSRVQQLYRDGFDIRVVSHYQIFHDKFAVIDDEKLIDGSYNWTERASHNNHEHCVVVRDEPDTIYKFVAEFERQWQFNTKKRSDLWFNKKR